MPMQPMQSITTKFFRDPEKFFEAQDWFEDVDIAPKPYG
jgi:hypothetical protein